MWNKPERLNAAANALYAIAALLALIGLAGMTMQLPVFALREVRFGGDLGHLTRGQLEAVVRRGLKGNFFTLDLAETRTLFEKLQWVRGVNLRRHWPDRLDVTLEEHVPLARWANKALVNTHGEIFEAAYGGRLPVFIGPPGTAKEIAIQYRYFHRSLAAIGQAPVQVHVSPRRAWRLKLEGGLTLELGRENIEARLDRFVAVYGRALDRLGRRIDHADLRYTNGFAVRVPALRRDKAKPKRGRSAA